MQAPETQTRERVGSGTEAHAPAPQYSRYHIDTRPAPPVARHPHRFTVEVSRVGLAKLIVTELWHYRAHPEVVFSRPCVYGVFSGPVGGFAPRDRLCVGCLRCTTQYPEMVRILPNPDRLTLGDAYFRPEIVDTLVYEAETGQVPVKGAGYRGRFGGEGWDGMWTDMSEIVRPTRDGIHGREFISTQVDLGERPAFLVFDDAGRPVGVVPRVVTLPLPLVFDVPPAAAGGRRVLETTARAAAALDTLAVVPVASLVGDVPAASALAGGHIVPLVRPAEVGLLAGLAFTPRLVEIDGTAPGGPLGGSTDASGTLRDGTDPDGTDPDSTPPDSPPPTGGADVDALVAAVDAARRLAPDAVVGLRLAFGPSLAGDLVRLVGRGVRAFHLVADLHGRATDGDFVLESIRRAHTGLVAAGRRDEVTLIGSGGMIAAEHVPKAILCGLDAVALDTPVLVALQATFEGECRDRAASRFTLPEADEAWGAQRLMNLAASWRDQLLEILGAMGMREVRRLRGEMGRAMFQRDLEREAFEGIEGYDA